MKVSLLIICMICVYWALKTTNVVEREPSRYVANDGIIEKDVEVRMNECLGYDECVDKNDDVCIGSGCDPVVIGLDAGNYATTGHNNVIIGPPAGEY